MTTDLDRQRSIQVIRESFAFFGMPIDDMTDEEIEQGVLKMGEVIGKTGLTADEALQNLAVMGAAARAR